MGRRVSLDGFADAVEQIIGEYADGVYATESKAVTYSTNQALRQVKSNAGVFDGEYAGGWKKQITRTNVTAEGVVYNVRPGLPHLLEKGHVKRGGHGRVSGTPHALPVQFHVNKVLMEKLKEGLSK